MRKKESMRILTALLALLMLMTALVACNKDDGPAESGHVDYVAETKLDMSSDSLKLNATVKLFVDGDTTHFYVQDSAFRDGFLKARYLSINTPESTGQLEEWGKTASAFTREKLESAVSIILESDDGKWNVDSTGDRYLLWIWYQPAEGAEYRNLNLEILQNGLAVASSSAQNRYGQICMKAIAQAKAEKLYVHSGKQDPSYPYGGAAEITLRELRCNVEDYEGKKVAVEGVVVQNSNNTVYLEAYDAEVDRTFGVQVYCGYNLAPGCQRALTIGNLVRVVGVLSYYETGGVYQIMDVEYNIMKPTDPNSTHAISEGHAPVNTPITDAEAFKNGTVELENDEKKETFSVAELAVHTSVSVKGLVVKSVWTTEDSENNKGALTLSCELNGKALNVRTVVMTDENGELITADAYEGKTIDVVGIVDYFKSEYQVKVFSPDAITVH